jgi:hypothetical protein
MSIAGAFIAGMVIYYWLRSIEERLDAREERKEPFYDHEERWYSQQRLPETTLPPKPKYKVPAHDPWEKYEKVVYPEKFDATGKRIYR